MMEFPWAYQKIEPTTWAYVSSLLMLALFFKFSRVWSVRNLDLFLIILLAPGLLLYDHGTTMEREACRALAELGEPAPLSLTSGGLLDQVADPDSPIDRDDDKAESPQPIAASESQGDGAGAESPADGASPPTDPETPDPVDNPALNTDSTNTNASENGLSVPETSQDDAAAGPAEQATSGQGTTGDATAQDPAGETGVDEAGADEDRTNGVESLQTPLVRGATTADSPEVAAQKWRARRDLSHILLHTSFLFLLCVAGVFVLRLLLDQILVRRPLLENNMTVGGLTFLVCSFLTFQVANILISSPTQTDLYGAQTAAGILGDGEADVDVGHQEMGPAYPLLHLLPVIPTVIRDTELAPTVEEAAKQELRNAGLVWSAKLVAILSQFAIVGGLIALGRYQFNSIQAGVGMATLYLMLPYTAQMTGRVDHVLPGALLIWAVVLYRHPFWAGILFGMMMGLVYYPIFLLALWLSFYWEKGASRFIYGVSTILGILVLSLFFFSTEERGFLENLQGMFGVWLPRVRGLKGIWEFGWDPWFRLPILVAYVSLSVSFVAWPIRKTYGTLLAYSAAMMVAVQFWHGYGGGLYMAWFLPLTIATFFRPNVQDRIARFDVV